MGVVSIDLQGFYVLLNTEVSPLATIINSGRNPETFNVSLQIEESGNTIYGDTETVLNLPDGNSIQVTFRDWTPGSEGILYDLKVTTLLPFDLNLENDTKKE